MFVQGTETHCFCIWPDYILLVHSGGVNEEVKQQVRQMKIHDRSCTTLLWFSKILIMQGAFNYFGLGF